MTNAYAESRPVGVAAAQRVPVPQTFEDILGGWPEDEIDDGFERALVTWRQSDGEQHG